MVLVNIIALREKIQQTDFYSQHLIDRTSYPRIGIFQTTDRLIAISRAQGDTNEDRLYEYVHFDVSAGPGAHIHRADTLHSRTVLMARKLGRYGIQVTALRFEPLGFGKLPLLSHGVGVQVRSRT